MSIYDFTVKDAAGQDIALADYKGKVLLIVNTATGCGFTPQFEGLENLYKKYAAQGLEILSFPSNQFLGQAPGTDEEIVSFCSLNYGTTFKTFSKIDVNGDDAAPLYKYLREQAPDDVENEGTAGFKQVLADLQQTLLGDKIKWNFTKFLVDQEGNVIDRYAPTVTPEELDAKIAALL